MKGLLGRLFGAAEAPADVFAEAASISLSVHPRAIVLRPGYRRQAPARGMVPSVTGQGREAAIVVSGTLAPEALGAAIRACFSKVETVTAVPEPKPPGPGETATDSMRDMLGLPKGAAVWKGMVSVSLRVREGRLQVVPLAPQGTPGGFAALPGDVSLWRDLPLDDAALGAVAWEAITLARAGGGDARPE